MTTTELNEDAMDSIVGGSSYISQLQRFLSINPQRMPSFSVLYQKEGDAPSKLTHVNVGATEMGFKSMIKLAESSGKIALIAANGSRTEFTADQLRAML